MSRGETPAAPGGQEAPQGSLQKQAAEPGATAGRGPRQAGGPAASGTTPRPGMPFPDWAAI